MRKLVLALVVMFLMAGLVIAASGVVTKVDGDKVTIKEGENEKEYTITDSTKFMTISGKDMTKKDSDKETFTKAAKGAKKGMKVEFEADGTKLKEVSFRSFGKKKNP